MVRKIIFVYNSDSGRLAGLLDSVKKAVGSPAACSLCTITHGLVKEKQEWQRAERELGVETAYYHRDDMPDAVRRHLQDTRQDTRQDNRQDNRDNEVSLPVVLFEDGEERLSVAVEAEALAACDGKPGCLEDHLQWALEAAS